MSRITSKLAIGALFLGGTLSAALAAGLPLGISQVDTGALPPTGEEWLSENPYRVDAVGEEIWQEAIKIGASGYNQNCARCHGLEAISGGLAPDLRYLEAEEYGDEWYVERFRVGATQNGITKMPGFGEVLGQDAAWAIRTYIETRPDDQAMADFTDELKTMRDQLQVYASDSDEADPEQMKSRLIEIAAEIPTLSGAPVADSIAAEAAMRIDGTPLGYSDAAETLTIGLSAAK